MYKKILLLLLPISLNVYGQSKLEKRYQLRERNRQLSNFTTKVDFSGEKKFSTIGFGLGSANYFGDLAPRQSRMSTDLSYSRSFISIFHLKKIHPNISLRSQLAYQRLRGDDFSISNVRNPNSSDKSRFERNLSFRNDIFEFSYSAIYELFQTHGYENRTFMNPYLVMGLSIYHHNPQTKTPISKEGKSEWVDLQPLGTEGQYTNMPGTSKPYSLWQVGVPFGFGLKYKLSRTCRYFDKWDSGIEFCYRFTFTDYLDDVGGYYPSDEAYQKMIDQGNFAGVTLSNRSAEVYSAIDNNDRRGVFRKWNDNSLSNETQVYLENESNSWSRIKSSKYKRGSRSRDYWLSVSIYLTYVIEVKEKPSKWR
jgi:hypothetical protein